MTHREYVDIIAAALGLAPPAPLPTWVGKLMGSLGETLSRSHRISNGKLRARCNWTPIHRSVRKGMPATLAAMAGQEASGEAA